MTFMSLFTCWWLLAPEMFLFSLPQRQLGQLLTMILCFSLRLPPLPSFPVSSQPSCPLKVKILKHNLKEVFKPHYIRKLFPDKNEASKKQDFSQRLSKGWKWSWLTGVDDLQTCQIYIRVFQDWSTLLLYEGNSLTSISVSPEWNVSITLNGGRLSDLIIWSEKSTWSSHPELLKPRLLKASFSDDSLSLWV